MNYQQKIINTFVEKYPNYYKLSDKEIWQRIGEYADKRGKNLKPFDSSLSSEINLQGDKVEHDLSYEHAKGYKHPNEWNDLLSVNMSSLFADNGDPLGLGSDEYWKNTYNQSMSGLYYQAKYGKPRYDAGDYDPGTIAHITSFFMSMAGPLDAYGFAKMGSIGHLSKEAAEKGVVNLGNYLSKKGTINNISKKAIAKTLEDRVHWPFLSEGIKNASQLTGSLAFYTGAFTGLQNAAEQSTTKGGWNNVDFGEVMAATGTGLLEGAGLGALTGGFMGAAFKGSSIWARLKQARNPKKISNTLKAIENIGGTSLTQIPAEAAAFTAFGSMLDPEHKFDLKTFLTNFGVIGTLKMHSRLMSGHPFFETGKTAKEDATSFIKTSIKMEHNQIKKNKKSVDNVLNTLNDKNQPIPKELIKEAAENDMRIEADVADKPMFEKALKEMARLDEKGEKNWTKSEQQWYLENVMAGPVGWSYEYFLQKYVKKLPDGKFELDLKEVDKYFEQNKKDGNEFNSSQKDLWKTSIVEQYKRILEIKDRLQESITNENNVSIDYENDRKISTSSKKKIPISEVDRPKEILEFDLKTTEGLRGAAEKLGFELSDGALIAELQKFDNRTEIQIKEKYGTDPNGKLLPDSKMKIAYEVVRNYAESQPSKIVDTDIKFESKAKTSEEFKEHVDKLRKDKKITDINRIADRAEKAYEEALNYTPEGTDNWSAREKNAFNESRDIVLQDVESMLRFLTKKSGQPLKQKDMIEYARNELKLAENLAEHGFSFKNVTRDKFIEAVIEEGVDSAPTNRIIQRVEKFNPEVKGITDTEISRMTKQAGQFKGEKTNIMPEGSHTGSIAPEVLVGGETILIYNQQIPKNKVYKRVIISEELANKIKALEIDNLDVLGRGEHTSEDGIIHEYSFFMNQSGKQIPMTGDFYGKVMKKIFKEAGFEHKTVGALRKTFSTFLELFDGQKIEVKGREIKIDADKIGSKILGHQSGSIREKFYTKENAELIDGYLYVHKRFTDMLTGKENITGKFKDPSPAKDNYFSITELKKVLDTMLKSKDVKNGDYIFTSQRKIALEHLEAAFRKHSELGNHINEIGTSVVELKEIKHPSQTVKKEIDANKKKSEKDAKLKSDIPEREITFESATEYLEFLYNELRKNPGLKIKTVTDAEYAGKYQEGIITVTLGKGGIKTFYHENAHRYKDMIYSTGNKGLISLWKSGESRFESDARRKGYFKTLSREEVARRKGISKSKLNQKDYKKYVMEEYLADLIMKYGAKRGEAKGLSKVGMWLKEMWSRAKKIFFGKDVLNKKDLIRIMGSDVWRGFESNRILKGDAKFSGVTGYDLAPEVQKLWSKVRKKLDYTDIKGAERIAESIGLENFRIREASVDDLIHFKEFISATEAGKEVLKENKIKLYKRISDINSKRRDKSVDINNELQKKILKEFGVFEGKIYNANESQLGAYEAIVNNLYRAPKRSMIDYIDDKAIVDIVRKSSQPWLANLYRSRPELVSAAVPVDKLLKMLGHKTLAKKLASRSSLEGSYNGMFRTFEEFAKSKLPEWEKGILRDRDSVRDMMYLLDSEVYIQYKKNKWLSDAEKRFLEKAFKPIWLEAEKPLKLSKLKADDYLNLTTAEGQVIKKYIDFTRDFAQEFKNIMRETLGEAEYEYFKDNATVKWVEDNIFVSRGLTDFGKEIIRFDSSYSEKWIAEEVQKRAIEKAKIEKTDDWEQFKDEFVSEVNSDFQNLLDFSPDKFTSRFIKKRNMLLPPKIKVDGKLYDIYETKWEPTSKRYAVGFSKLLANMTIFPELVKIDGFKKGSFAGAGMTDVLSKIRKVNAGWADTIEKIMKQELGMGMTTNPSAWPKFLNAAASTLAKTGLSFPTSGIKNLILGTGQSLAAYKTKYLIEGMADVMSADFRKEVVALGATDIGMREYKTYKTTKALDKVFVLGGMRPSENFNRYLAVAAGRRDFAHHIENIKMLRGKSKGYKKSIDYLDKYYEMSKAEIELLKKYGVKGFDAEQAINASGEKFASITKKNAEIRKLNTIYKKAQFMSHVNTQGASLSLYMPMWASKAYAKPLTLFKRMAYAATRNTARNTGLALKNGQWGKVLMQGLIPLGSGYLMMGLWDLLFDKSEMPTERNDWFGIKNIATVLQRGEFLGIGSEVVGLLGENGDRVNLNPALLDAFYNLGHGIYAVASGEKTGEQSGKDTLKRLLSLYNQSAKVAKNIADKSNFRAIDTRMDKAFRRYNKDVYPDKPIFEAGRNPNAKYYRELTDAFAAGDMDRAAREFIISNHMLASYYYKEGRTDDGKYFIRTWDDAIKEANKQMKKRLKNLNPNQASTYKRGDVYKRRVARFWKWYEDINGLEKTKSFKDVMIGGEKEYYSRVKDMMKKISEYRSKLNIDYDEFDKLDFMSSKEYQQLMNL